MPQEQIYQGQVAPRATPQSSQASAAEFGSGVGAGIEQVGGALYDAKLSSYKRDRQLTADQESARVNADMAKLQLANHQAVEDLRTNTNPEDRVI